jgi:hypothetical protein
MPLSGLETPNRLLLSIPADSAFNILHTKDSKLEKEELHTMLLKMPREQSSSSVHLITRLQAKK